MTAFDSNSSSRWTKFAKGVMSFAAGLLCVFGVMSSVGVAADDDVITIPSRGKNSITHVGRKFPGSKFNLHILATESFANRLITRTNSESSEVVDFILGANVNGWQTTDSVLTADFKPNRRYGQIVFSLSGHTHSETLGTTNQATIDTLGQYRFLTVKPAFFDGKKFLTSRSTTTVEANNINRGVVTAYSGLPIIGAFADQQARMQVARTKTAAEQIAAGRLADRVNPRMTSEIDKQLADINTLIAGQTAKWLSPQQLEPDFTHATTSNDYFRYSAGIKSETLPVDTPVPLDRPHGKLLSIYIHESLFEQLMNRMNLSGLEVSDRTLQLLVRRLGGTVADPVEVNGDLGAAAVYSLVFDTQRPAFLDVDNGQIKLNLRFAVKPVVAPAVLEGLDETERDAILADARALPMQTLSIPWSMSTSEELIAINPGPVTVVAAKQPTSTNAGEEPDESASAATDFTSKLIETTLQEKLESLKLPGKFELPLPSGRKLSLTIQTAVAKNGWLMLAID
jgi:hypothetical protein